MAIHNADEVRGLKITFDKAVFRHRLLSWYDRNRQPYPWRIDWQQTGDPYRVWLSEVMLQQTVIKAVIPAYKTFLTELPTIEHLANVSGDEVKRLVRGLGYYRRFGLFKQAADQLVSKSALDSSTRGFPWPQNAKEWTELPGIGPYTAAALASITNNEPVAVLDGNVERVLCRLFDIHLPSNLPSLKSGFKRLSQELIDVRPGDFNQAVMELGQQICRPTSPQCESCPVHEFCLAKSRRTQSEAPKPKIKKESIAINLQLYLLIREKKVALVERPKSAKFLRGTWGFITSLEGRGDGFPLDRGALSISKPVGHITHNITHHRIKAEVLVLPANYKVPNARWVEFDVIEENLISNLDRKAWHLTVREGCHNM